MLETSLYYIALRALVFVSFYSLLNKLSYMLGCGGISLKSAPVAGKVTQDFSPPACFLLSGHNLDWLDESHKIPGEGVGQGCENIKWLSQHLL